MKRKKIAFFVLNIFQVGGIEKVVTIVANKLINKYDIMIVSLFKTSSLPFYDLNKKVKVINMFEKEFNVRNNFFKIKSSIKKKLDKYEIDIFINCGMGYVPLNIFMRKRAYYISWEHSNCMIGKKIGLTWWGRFLSSKYADTIIFLTKKDQINFKKMYKCNKKVNLTQIYNPIELQAISHKYNSKSKKILSCGRLDEQKGFDILIEVAKIVFEKEKKWQWHIYGDGKERNRLEELIKKNNLEKNVILKGTVKNMHEIYKDYSFFVLTSRYEGFCLVNIEASSNLLPIISFNCPCGPDEIITENINGFIIDNFDKNKMAEKVLKLINDEKLRIKFSNNSNYDKEKLNIDHIINQWLNLLDNLGEKK